MPFTSKLGAPESQLGNIVLGRSPPISLTQAVSQTLSFNQDVRVSPALVSGTNTLTLNQTASASVAYFPGESGMSFTSKLGAPESQLGNIVLGLPVNGGLNQTVSQTISFSQDVLVNTLLASGSNSLVLNQTASVSVDRAVSVSQSLSLTQELGRSVPESVSDTLSLTDQATSVREAHATVSDTLTLVQATAENIKNVSVSQSLGLVQTVENHGAIRVNVAQTLNLVQSEDGHQGVNNQAVVDPLIFVDVAGLTWEISVSQTLALSQTGERTNIITDILNLTQTVSAGKGGDASDTLAFVQTVSRTGILNRSLSHSLSLQQSVTYLLDRPCARKQYTPFVGSSTDTAYTPPSLTAPTIGSHKLTLTYPYSSPSNTLVLRNPEFSDKDRLAFNRINRTTRGGSLIVFADPKWPKTQTLAVQVDNLSQQQASDLIAFLRLSLGQEIGLLDWENRQWRGIVTTPNAQVTHTGRNDISVSFEFQGTLA